jgi:DNA-binding response OmpR family regulator/HPt (histidine-containing phosphotransfer) domain-containing protein
MSLDSRMVCYGPPMPAAPGPREEEARLTGARAEFASSLPRRLETLRGALLAAEQEPGDADRVKGLLRRVHAVGSAARVLGFASVAEALAEAERSVRQAESAGKPPPFADIARAFDVLPSLILGVPVSERGPEQPARPTATSPTSVLVLGSAALASALAETNGGPAFESERLDDPARLVELTHIVGPDVIVVDGDVSGVREALAKLFADAMLEPIPVIVVGTFENPQHGAAFVELGVARVLPKPCTPDTLRRTVAELRERAARPRPAREPLGEMTVSSLVERIAGEFKRGLVDALETVTPNVPVPLGEGHDVLAAVWGAVARVRELVTVRSGGSMRFEATGPEGGVPFAPWGGAERRAGERGREQRDTEGIALHGRRIVVADDDPAVVWFMAGILRSVGVDVLEAHDGKRALELAFEAWPDAIVSDVLMPKLDGFSLCHELKRDVALRDVPVILLSWKEDLLQRVRELGAAADGYLRKEATAAAVLERVREVLRTRARVEERIGAGGEVRGRLDGLTPRLVLDLCCRGERNVRVSVRDAAFLFEAQVRGGRLVSLTRSAPDETFLQGAAVVPSLLGVSAGRFSVEPDASACRSELSGSLFEILREPIARARASLAAVSAGALLRLERVELERTLAETYQRSTPEPAAGVVRRLLQGQSPAELVVSGAVSPSVLEVVLSDIARRGGVLSFVAAPGPRSVPPPEPRVEGATPLVAPAAPVAAPVPAPIPTAATAVDSSDAGWFEGDAPAAPVATTPLRVEGHSTTLPLNTELTPGAESEPTFSFGMGPSTLEGIGTALPRAEAGLAPPSPQPSNSDPELGAHVIGLIGESAASDSGDEPPERPPTTERLPMDPWAVPSPFVTSNLPVVNAAPPALHPSKTMRSSDPPAARPHADSAPPVETVEQKTEPPEKFDKTLKATDIDPKRLPTQPPQRGRSSAKPAAKAPDSASSGAVGKLLVRSAIAGAIAFAATTWFLLPLLGPDKDGDAAHSVEQVPEASSATAAPAAPSEAGLAAEELDAPAGIQLAPGQGIIEVEAAGADPIYVDDAFVGLGPLRRVSAPAGAHRVEVRSPNAPRRADVTLNAGKRTRVKAPAATPAPSTSAP